MIQYLINLLIFLPFILILIVLSTKLNKFKLEKIGIYRHIKIIERTTLKKDNDVFVLKIGDEGIIIISSSNKIEVLKNLTKDEINIIENKKTKNKINTKIFRKNDKNS